MIPAANLISDTLGEVARWIKPGITTRRLDTIAREYIIDNGGTPACLGFEGFPGTLCIEVNETIVHGFPSTYTLREGDIIGIDTVVKKDGFMADMCYTFPVGEITDQKSNCCSQPKNHSTKESNNAGSAPGSATSQTPSNATAKQEATPSCANSADTA